MTTLENAALMLGQGVGTERDGSERHTAVGAVAFQRSLEKRAGKGVDRKQTQISLSFVQQALICLNLPNLGKPFVVAVY